MIHPAVQPEVWRRRRIALFAALPVLIVVRLALWVLPFPRIHRHVGAIRPRRTSTYNDPTTVTRLVRAVRSAARLVPRATCLTQAIALQYLLARSGRAGEIHIGVRRDTSGKFIAHAWVELDGVVVIGGGEDLASFVPLLQLQEVPE